MKNTSDCIKSIRRTRNLVFQSILTLHLFVKRLENSWAPKYKISTYFPKILSTFFGYQTYSCIFFLVVVTI